MVKFRLAGMRGDKRRGFTLTELTMVLGILGLVLGAVWITSQKLTRNRHISQAVNETLTIANGVRAFYTKGHVDGPADVTAAMINQGVYPADMIKSVCGGTGAYTGQAPSPAPCPMDPWEGGAVQIGTDLGWWGAPATMTSFQLMFWNDKMTDCPAFVGALIAQGANLGANWIYAAGMNAVDPRTADVTAPANCTGYVTINFQL